MKMYAIFDAMPEHDRMVTGAYHYLNLPTGHVLFVCEPQNHAAAEKHLTELGAALFPDLMGHEPLPQEVHSHAAFKGAGLSSLHTTFTAAKHLSKHLGWPTLDPRN